MTTESCLSGTFFIHINAFFISNAFFNSASALLHLFCESMIIDKHNTRYYGKKYVGFEPEELPKIVNDADQTDFEKQKQNIKEAEKQIKIGY